MKLFYDTQWPYRLLLQLPSRTRATIAFTAFSGFDLTDRVTVRDTFARLVGRRHMSVTGPRKGGEGGEGGDLALQGLRQSLECS